MVVDALERLEATFDTDAVYIATVPHLKDPLLAIMPEFSPERIFAEPAKRNTCGCLVWATAQLLATGADAKDLVMAVSTADHHIAPPEKFKETLQAALEIAETGDNIVTETRPDGRIQERCRICCQEKWRTRKAALKEKKMATTYT